MALVLEGGADGLEDGVAHVGGGMNEVKVFSASFADDAREGLIAVDVGPDVLPEFLEDKGGAGKVECGKVGVGEDMLDSLCRRAGYELDDGGREACFQQNLVDNVVGIGGCRRGLPDDDIAHQSGCTGEVAANSGKIEGRDRKDEAF